MGAAELDVLDQVTSEAWASGWEPAPDINVWQWADQYRVLSGKGAAEPGQWRTDRVPYMREPMEMLSPQSPVQRVVLMFASQMAKTETGNNWLGYIAHHAPGPALFVMPTISALKKNVLQRINPMISETPVLAERFAKPASRDAANNMFVKEFAGGMLILTGANSANELSSMPIRYLYGDEIDRWPYDVDGNGDPLDMAEQRLVSFRNRKKILLTSTPTIKGVSAIEREFKRGDQRYFFVPCPHCGQMQTLRWKDDEEIGSTLRVRWDRDSTGKHLTKTARYACEGCGVLIEERHKRAMVALGEWRATAPFDGETVSYHLNALYSPFTSWAEIGAAFLRAKDTPEKLQVWTNTKLAETWEESGFALNANVLQRRLEQYDRAVVPTGAALLLGAADVQGDRIEAKIIAFGPGEESWLIDFEIFWGDPSSDASVWARLDEWRRRDFLHEGSGRPMRLSIFGVDSGDQADAVYDYVQPRQAERVFALKGSDYLSRPGLVMEGSTKRSHLKLYRVATFAAKERLVSRLRLEQPGPGYLHLPSWVPDQYLDQMTSEKKLTRKDPRRGTVTVVWVVTGRNEAFDLEVYCLGLLFVLQNFTNPTMYRDLTRLHQAIMTGIAVGPVARGRGVRSSGIDPNA